MTEPCWAIVVDGVSQGAHNSLGRQAGQVWSELRDFPCESFEQRTSWAQGPGDCCVLSSARGCLALTLACKLLSEAPLGQMESSCTSRAGMAP